MKSYRKTAQFFVAVIFAVCFNPVANKQCYRNQFIFFTGYQKTTTLAFDLCTYGHKIFFNISLKSIEIIVQHIAWSLWTWAKAVEMLFSNSRIKSRWLINSGFSKCYFNNWLVLDWKHGMILWKRIFWVGRSLNLSAIFLCYWRHYLPHMQISFLKDTLSSPEVKKYYSSESDNSFSLLFKNNPFCLYKKCVHIAGSYFQAKHL